jgi:mono/diheme cytochrome c family protein
MQRQCRAVRASQVAGMVGPMSRFVRFVFAAALVPAAASPGVETAYADAALIARGHAIAKYNCSHCHAIGRTDASRDLRAPPLRALSRKYPLSGLEESLAEGIMVGHEGLQMQHYQLSPAQIEALLTYMASIQVK